MNPGKIIRIKRWKFITSIIAIVVVLALWGIFCFLQTQVFYSSGARAGNVSNLLPPSAGSAESGVVNKMMPDYYNYGGNQQPSVTDTREFQKVSYSASIKSRAVKDTITNVNNIIKGADGRVDSLYSSEESGRITFIVAKSKFDAFRDQMEKLTHEKLYSETISSTNLLGQKQGIEQWQNQATTSLADLNKQKASLIVAHAKTVNQINGELQNIQSALVTVQAKLETATSSTVIATLKNEESFLASQAETQREKLSLENDNYSVQAKTLDNLIAGENNNLANANKQDTLFGDNIETVSGSVYVSWVSMWELVKIYSPIHPTIIIIILIIIGWIILKRKGYIPKVVLE